jgi:hypothetical protein
VAASAAAAGCRDASAPITDEVAAPTGSWAMASGDEPTTMASMSSVWRIDSSPMPDVIEAWTDAFAVRVKASAGR